MLWRMDAVTKALEAIAAATPRRPASCCPWSTMSCACSPRKRLAQEQPGQTLQATALVHEAYLRLVGDRGRPHWDDRGHFFAAAAEAMRRILVENARRKGRLRAMAAAGSGCRWTGSTWRRRPRRMTCWPWTRPWRS